MMIQHFTFQCDDEDVLEELGRDAPISETGGDDLLGFCREELDACIHGCYDVELDVELDEGVMGRLGRSWVEGKG